MGRVLALAAAIAVSIVWVPSSRAGTIVANVADGILTVNGTTEGDDVTVRCESGQVTVNHNHPSGGPPRAPTCVASSCSPARDPIA